jgi:hypothetical protein
MQTERDLMSELERLDSFLDGTEPGDIPTEILRERGIELVDEGSLSDEDVHRRLWEVIDAMATLGLFLESTDHLSDRELYRYLGDALKEETLLSDDPASACHLTPIGGGSEEDNEIYLRYYADDEDRRMWAEDGTTIPPHEALPFDRDGLLPKPRR